MLLLQCVTENMFSNALNGYTCDVKHFSEHFWKKVHCGFQKIWFLFFFSRKWRFPKLYCLALWAYKYYQKNLVIFFFPLYIYKLSTGNKILNLRE
jgi:hypothetical protein